MNEYYRNLKPYTWDEIKHIESKIYATQLISDSIEDPNTRIDNILKRDIFVFYDKTYNLPQNIFFLKISRDVVLVGRKILSDLYLANKIKALNCSKITPSMLLGILYETKKDRDNIYVSYYPLTSGEKLHIFNSNINNRLIDIYFPFRYSDYYTKKEKTSPSQGWSLTEEKVVYLGWGEKHIRDYTIEYFLKNNIIDGKPIVFDPACSTGEFLYTIKKYFPSCTTVGQDLSKEMVRYANNFVDITYHGNSINPYMENNTVDILLLRFLNSEVVSTVMAYRLLTRLIRTVKPGGLIFCFGHTPVLLRYVFFAKKNLRIIQANGLDTTTNGIFQYYVLHKPL